MDGWMDGYIWSNSQKYIVWVKIIDFSFMPKIISILSKWITSRFIEQREMEDHGEQWQVSENTETSP